jgi:hypothetical protein
MAKVNYNYGKLKNGVIEYAPSKVAYNGRWVFNPKPATLIALGYKEIVKDEYPDEPPTEGFYYLEVYSEDEAHIYIKYQMSPIDSEV